jgi:hypothetical protein
LRHERSRRSLGRRSVTAHNSRHSTPKFYSRRAGYSDRFKAEQLRALLALIVLAVMVRMALGLVVRPSDLYSIEGRGAGVSQRARLPARSA